MPVLRRGPTKPALTLLLALLVMTATFYSVRELRGSPSVDADEPSAPWADRPEGWMQDLLRADDEAPRFDGTLNGIRIAPTLPPSPSQCGPDERAQYVGAESVAGANVEIRPSYLPGGALTTRETVIACPDGRVIEHVREFEVPTDAGLGRFGGPLQIVRGEGAHRFAHDGAANKAEATQVAGRAAVLFRPLSDDGFGQSALFIAEPWGMTAIQAYGLSETELLKVASGLYEDGGTQ